MVFPLIETTGVIDDILCLYKNRHRPKRGKQLYCFYATPKGEKPTLKEKPWHNYIDNANSLLNKVLTRSEKRNSSVVPLSIMEVALKPKPTSNKKRKLGEENPPPSRHGKLLFYVPTPPPLIHQHIGTRLYADC